MERDLDALVHDVRCGYVSRESAETVYGAVFANDGGIDRAATAECRADMRKQDLPIDQPISETLVPPPSHAHEHAYPPDVLTDEERIVIAMNFRCCS